jgi:hypothetical protein
LRTLVELAPRPQGFFHGLLVSEVTRDLDAWAPRRVVPRVVPRAALASALGALALLAVVTYLAAFAPPPAPTLAFSDAPLAGLPGAAPDDAAVGERVVVAPGVPRDDGDMPAPIRDESASSLASLSSRIQENVRQQVWGKAWERVRDALARAGTSGRGAADENGDEATVAANDRADAEAGGETGSAAQRRSGVGKQPTEGADDDRDDPASPQADAETGGNDGGGEGGGGAGNGTSPNLFGGEPVDTAGNGSFELALAARMRADRTRGQRGTGAGGPSADPDARPALGADQRREAAAHRMTVPAAYETVVREVFAHRRSDGGER